MNKAAALEYQAGSAVGADGDHLPPQSIRAPAPAASLSPGAEAGKAWASAVAEAGGSSEVAILSGATTLATTDGSSDGVNLVANGIAMVNGGSGDPVLAGEREGPPDSLHPGSGAELEVASVESTGGQLRRGGGANGCAPPEAADAFSLSTVPPQSKSSKYGKGSGYKAKGKKKGGSQLMKDYQPIDDTLLCNVCMDAQSYDHNPFLQCAR